jgi:hypothetical protein
MNNSEDQILEHIIRRMQTDMAVDAPADAVRYSKNLFRARASQPKESMLRRILAVMRADLAPGTAAFGERSTGEGQARQMLFDSGDNAVDIRIHKVKKNFTIRGQIFGAGFAKCRIEINSGSRSFTTQIDDMGEFRFDDIRPGEYSVVVRGHDQEIVIESVSFN